ncbi:MAG: Verru_Chthon cassette protein B [Terrimicrobiaceae bacterium]
MDTSKYSDPEKSGGFTLVEVTLALGVASFALVVLFGLLPVGLTISRGAADSVMGAQISQRVINDALQTDFDTLVESGATTLFRKPVRYFGEQGNELLGPDGAIYHVNTRVAVSTGVPGNGVATNPDVATVTVQIVNNPGNIGLSVGAGGSPTAMLWTGFPSGGQGGIKTFSAQVSRNR